MNLKVSAEIPPETSHHQPTHHPKPQPRFLLPPPTPHQPLPSFLLPPRTLPRPHPVAPGVPPVLWGAGGKRRRCCAWVDRRRLSSSSTRGNSHTRLTRTFRGASFSAWAMRATACLWYPNSAGLRLRICILRLSGSLAAGRLFPFLFLYLHSEVRPPHYMQAAERWTASELLES